MNFGRPGAAPGGLRSGWRARARAAMAWLTAGMLWLALAPPALAAEPDPKQEVTSTSQAARVTSASQAALVTRTFSLRSKDLDALPPEQARSYQRRLVEAIRAYLYPPKDPAAAAPAGRRIAFDEAKMELTLSDSPERVEKIATYLEQLLAASARSKATQTLEIKHMSAAALLERVDEMVSQPDDEATLQLRVGEPARLHGVWLKLTALARDGSEKIFNRAVQIEIGSPGDQTRTYILAERKPLELGPFRLRLDQVRLNAPAGEWQARIHAAYTARGGRSQMANGIFEKVEFTTTTQPNQLIVRAPDRDRLQSALQILALLDQPPRIFEVEILHMERKTTATLAQEGEALRGAMEWVNGAPNFEQAARGINANPVFKATALRKITTLARRPCLARLELSHDPQAVDTADFVEIAFSILEAGQGQNITLDGCTVTRRVGGRKSTVSSNLRLNPGGCAILSSPFTKVAGGGNLPDLFIKARRIQ